MYPNLILQWIIDRLEGGREVLRRGLRFPLRQHFAMLSLYLHLSSLNLFHLIYVVVVILFALDCFINLVLAYVHIPYIHCLIISLNWYFVIWGSKRSRVFYTHFEHSAQEPQKSQAECSYYPTEFHCGFCVLRGTKKKKAWLSPQRHLHGLRQAPH